MFIKPLHDLIIVLGIETSSATSNNSQMDFSWFRLTPEGDQVAPVR
jgi:hypothetical protein